MSAPEYAPKQTEEPMSDFYSRSISKILDSVVKPSKITKKIKTRKGKIMTHRPKITESKRKLSKIESKHSSAMKDYNIDSKENRPLQLNSMNNSRVNKFYKTQQKIKVEEELIEELQSNFKLIM